MNSITYIGKITTLSPIAHNSDESLGTDTKYRRIAIIHNGRNVRIPVYSGNAYRGILRRMAAKQFCDLLGLAKESMSDVLYYTWFTGGALKKGSAQNYIEIGQKRELREKIPFLSLFGTALQNQIIPGKLSVGMAMPIAAETAHMTGVDSELTVWEMLDEVFYTRRDDLEDPQEARGKDDTAQQMKYTIEVLVPGVELHHKIALEMVGDVELACFGHLMREFVKQGTIGGKSGTGHGKVKFDYSPEWPDAKAYLDYVAQNKDAVMEYIRDMEKKL